MFLWKAEVLHAKTRDDTGLCYVLSSPIGSVFISTPGIDVWSFRLFVFGICVHAAITDYVDEQSCVSYLARDDAVIHLVAHSANAFVDIS
jgi:hypothetical protein